jgi:hypothetical protein
VKGHGLLSSNGSAAKFTGIYAGKLPKKGL